MFMYRDRRIAFEDPDMYEETPLSLSESIVEVADDYTKRKNVFRVCTKGESSPSECLFQAEQEDSMVDWVTAIEDTSNVDGSTTNISGATSSVASSYTEGIKKLAMRNRSPSAHSSPAAKARRVSNGEKVHILQVS